jgi:EAL domain-containing protein (putative c-di-GMP-specific phosphodiesterase class I)
VLEIAETALIENPERAGLMLDHLSGVGLRLSLDDFGQGYTSLGQLRNLPFHELKIDKSFVMNMVDDAGNAAIVRSVIDIGHNLGLDVVAEGVETVETLQALVELGGDLAQGYYFSQPLPADQIPEWLSTHAPQSNPAEDRFQD